MRNEKKEVDSNVRLRVIGKAMTPTLQPYMTSKQNSIGNGDLISPIFTNNLYELINDSAPFSNCILTTAKYVCDFGYRLVIKEENSNQNRENSKEIQQKIRNLENNNEITGLNKELDKLKAKLQIEIEREKKQSEILKEKNFIENVLSNVNPEKPVTKVLKTGFIHALLYGYSGFEVVFNGIKDRFQLISIPSHEFRYTERDNDFTEYYFTDLEGKETSMYWRFRRYAQYQGDVDFQDSSYNYNTIYFKDINDPRQVNYKTGEYAINEILPDSEEANSCIPIEIGIKQDSEYPYPIWLGVLNDILGYTYATKLNRQWFEDGMLVPMAIVVDGVLDENTYNELTTLLETAKGINNSAKLIIIENLEKATGGSTGLNLKSGMDNSFKVNFEKLPAMDLKDGQFLEYIRQTVKNIRMIFNIPAIVLGLEESYNRSTASMAIEMANKQFQSYRNELEKVINICLKQIGVKYHEFKLNTPNIQDYKEVVEMLKPFIDNDLIPINTIHSIFNEIFNTNIEENQKLIDEWKKERNLNSENRPVLNDNTTTELENNENLEIIKSEIKKILKSSNIKHDILDLNSIQ